MPPLLDFDVLCVVVAHSTWYTLFSLIRTCRQLNREAAKRILGHPNLEAAIEIDGLGDRRAMSFINFIRADGGRYHYLRSLALGGERLSLEVCEGLADIIRQAISLRRLR